MMWVVILSHTYFTITNFNFWELWRQFICSAYYKYWV